MSSANPRHQTSAEVDPDRIASGVEGGLRDQVQGWLRRVRGGEMGAVPAIAGLVLLFILMTSLSPFFLTAGNMANLLNQSATLVMLGMALVFTLLLGEIDLSAGVTGGTSMAIFIVLVDKGHWPWVPALLVGFAFGLLTGAVLGFFVARIGIPSFVVSLGLFLGYQGLALVVVGAGGVYQINIPALKAIQNDNLSILGGWIFLAIVVAISAGTVLLDRYRRTKSGVPNRTIYLDMIKVGMVLVLGAAAVFALNINRAPTQAKVPIEGVPIIVPVTLGVLWLGTLLLDRTRFGRYIYAIGGNAEAARRAGVRVRWVKWWAFVIGSSLAVVSALLSVTRVGSVDATAGREIVLSGVAAAVVGGVSLFGGRGRLVHAALGAVVIATITNGLGLLNMPAGANLLVTGGVLILAATVDAVSRLRGGARRPEGNLLAHWLKGLYKLFNRPAEVPVEPAAAQD